MVREEKSRQVGLDSPESRVSPYEDINTKQTRMTGEKFPTLALGICDNCHWCYTLINERGRVRVCPICNRNVSQIPMSLDEVCIIEKDEKRGFTITFDRRLPLR
jgi:hypothetical protein